MNDEIPMTPEMALRYDFNATMASLTAVAQDANDALDRLYALLGDR